MSHMTTKDTILPVLRPNQDVENNRDVKLKDSPDLLGRLLDEVKLEKQTSSSFHVSESGLKDIGNGFLDELEALDNAIYGLDVPSVASTSKNPPAQVNQRKRGRPRKGTHASPINSEPTNNVFDKKKRRNELIKPNDITDLEYHSEFEQSDCGGSTSKRRRQPKVLSDFVSDFDTSDEELGMLPSSTAFEIPKFKSNSRGKKKKAKSLHSLEGEDMLSYYLGDFDEGFSDQDEFCHEFLDEEEASVVLGKEKTVGDNNAMPDDKIQRTFQKPENSKPANILFHSDDIEAPKEKKRKPKEASREIQQLTALQQKCNLLQQRLQKKPQMNRVFDLLHGASKFLSEEQLVFLTMQLKSNCKSLHGIRFSAREKVLALAIYAHSPETYKWMQSMFYLPTKLILDRWLEAMAKSNPESAKRLMYYVFKNYIFNS